MLWERLGRANDVAICIHYVSDGAAARAPHSAHVCPTNTLIGGRGVIIRL
jgi:hypothetical protein